MPSYLHTHLAEHFVTALILSKKTKTLGLTPVAFLNSSGDFNLHPGLLGPSSLLKYCCVCSSTQHVVF